MANPHFKMLWHEKIPQVKPAEGVELSLVAGSMKGVENPLPPPPESWAAQSENEVAIWTLRMAPGSRYELPPCQSALGIRRTVYFFKGPVARVGGKELQSHGAVEVKTDVPCDLYNSGSKEHVEFLVLQGRPIGEPIVQHGPFVMNDRRAYRKLLPIISVMNLVAGPTRVMDLCMPAIKAALHSMQMVASINLDSGISRCVPCSPGHTMGCLI